MKFACSSRQTVPDSPFYMIGYAGDQREKPAEGIRDIPEVNTICMEISGRVICMCTADVCVFSRDKTDAVRKKICDRFSMNYEDVSICSIHSHSCPNGTIDDSRGFNKHNRNDAYLEKVTDAIMDSVHDCMLRLEPAVAKYCITSIKGFYSNRNDLKEPYDSDAVLMLFERENGEVLGGFLNISVHSTVLGPDNMYCSYDLIGTIRTYLKDHYKCNILATMGAAGDISNRQYRKGNGFEELRRVAAGITEQIIDNRVYYRIPLDSVSEKTLDHPVRYDNRVYFDQYKDKLSSLEVSLKDPTLSRDQYKLLLTSKKQFEGKLNRDTVEFNAITKIFDFGSMLLIGFGGEMSSILGMKIKHSAKDRLTVIVTCCDDDLGYFIEEDKYGRYYETIATDVPKGEPEKIADAIINAI